MYSYGLFTVYSNDYPDGRFQSIDDHLAMLQDYHLLYSFIHKDIATANFMDTVSRYDHEGAIETANYIK